MLSRTRNKFVIYSYSYVSRLSRTRNRITSNMGHKGVNSTNHPLKHGHVTYIIIIAINVQVNKNNKNNYEDFSVATRQEVK